MVICNESGSRLSVGHFHKTYGLLRGLVALNSGIIIKPDSDIGALIMFLRYIGIFLN